MEDQERRKWLKKENPMQPKPNVVKILIKNGDAGIQQTGPQERYLIVDGYNIIFAWKNLNEEFAISIFDSARDKLLDI